MSGARRTTTAPSRHSRIKPKNADREKRSDCGQPPKCANAIRQTPTTRSTCSPFAGSVSQAVQTPYSTGIELHCRTGCTLLLPAVAPASFVALWRSHCYPSVILCKAITVCTDIYSTPPAAATTTTIAKPGQTGHLHCICSLSLSLGTTDTRTAAACRRVGGVFQVPEKSSSFLWSLEELNCVSLARFASTRLGVFPILLFWGNSRNAPNGLNS